MPDWSTELWLREYLSPHDVYMHGVTNVLAKTCTEFQAMWIIETRTFGKALLLDGKWQSCTADEYLYHEALVHVPALVHAGPRNVLILGGGEGATAREILRWNTVERVVMIDIDREVVAACKQYLRDMHQGAFDDPRLEVIIADAREYLERSGKDFDLVISDLSEPVEDGPSYRLFTREHIQDIKSVLTEGGVFGMQAGSLSHHEMHLHARLARTVQSVFPEVVSYQVAVPSFATPWGFLVARDGRLDTRPDPAAVDSTLEDHVDGRLRLIDGSTYLGLLQTQRPIRDAIAARSDIYTRDDPPILEDLAGRS